MLQFVECIYVNYWFHFISATFFSIRVTFFSIRVTFFSISVTFFSISVTFFSITWGNLMHESRNCYIQLYSLTAEVMHNDIIRIIVHSMMCSSPAVAIIKRNEEFIFIKFQPSRKLPLITPEVKKDHEIHQISARRWSVSVPHKNFYPINLVLPH